MHIVDSLISSGGERVSDLTLRSRISAPINFLENNFPPPPPLNNVSTFLDEICKKVGAVSELPNNKWDILETVFQKVIAFIDIHGDVCINGYWCIVSPKRPAPRLIHLEEFSTPLRLLGPPNIRDLRVGPNVVISINYSFVSTSM